jgi:L-threonylcarbamoyladenylate synthase
VIEEAVRVLEEGGVVAAATESVFGLLADATNPKAIDRLLSLKPRGADKGQPLMVPSVEVWSGIVLEVPPMAERLARAFWPGRMTLVLPVRPGAVDPRVVLDGTVAVREPGASPAARLVAAFGRPVTATSANSPGEPPASTVAQLTAYFPSAIERGELSVLDGVAPGGAVSTIVAVRGDRYHVVRHGAVALEDLRHVADAEM